MLALGFAADALVLVHNPGPRRRGSPRRSGQARQTSAGLAFAGGRLAETGSSSWIRRVDDAPMDGYHRGAGRCGGMIAAGRRFLPQATGAKMQVVGRVSLSPKHAVYLLRVGQRVLVVGTGPQGAPALISEMDELAEIEPPAPPGDNHEAPTSVWSRAGASVSSRYCGRVPMPSVRLAKPKSLALALLAVLAILMLSGPGRADQPSARDATAATREATDSVHVNRPSGDGAAPTAGPLQIPLVERDVWKTVETFALFGLISLAPMGLLMATAFVRINVVLILLRQASGARNYPVTRS